MSHHAEDRTAQGVAGCGVDLLGQGWYRVGGGRGGAAEDISVVEGIGDTMSRGRSGSV